MSPPDTESRAPAPELEGEQEIDFGKYLRRIALRWWLLVIGALAGVVIGFLVSTGTSRPYDARAIVYLGRPRAPDGGAIEPLGVKFVFAGELLASESTIRQVADQVGVRPAALREAASLEPVSALTLGTSERATNFAQIRVEGLPRAKARRAANALASILANDFSSFVDLRLRNYRARRARARRELVQVNARIAFAEKEQAKVLADTSLPNTERLIILANYNNVLQFNENRQSNLEGTLLQVEEVIALAEEVERARVVGPATTSRAAPPSSRTSAVIGGLIGLLVGILAALLWDPIAGRLESREST